MSADRVARIVFAPIARVVAAVRERFARARCRDEAGWDAAPTGAAHDTGAAEGGWSLDLPDDREKPTR